MILFGIIMYSISVIELKSVCDIVGSWVLIGRNSGRIF